MTLSMTDVMRAVRNYFVTGYADGAWQVSGGMLSGPETIPAHQWIAIADSHCCDGVYQLDEQGLLPGAAEGSWTGRVRFLSPPGDFLRLVKDINAWIAGREAASPLKQERFGAYSRTWQDEASALDWETAFAARLAPWRRMFPEVNL